MKLKKLIIQFLFVSLALMTFSACKQSGAESGPTPEQALKLDTGVMMDPASDVQSASVAILAQAEALLVEQASRRPRDT